MSFYFPPLQVYYVQFNVGLVTQYAMREWLDSRPEVLNYMWVHVDSVAIVTQASVHDVSNLIREQYPNMNFMAAQLSRMTMNGWMPQAFWDFVNNPQPSGRWPAQTLF
jgi:hypothetical protein